MALDNSSASSHEIAKLQAQILLLKGQNADLATNNAQLAEELERAKAELRETQALLGRAAVDVARQSQVCRLVALGPVVLLTVLVFFHCRVQSLL